MSSMFLFVFDKYDDDDDDDDENTNIIFLIN